jgi:hypothetical protein
MPIQTTPSRLGQVNLANDTDALFLKVFSGEIIASFEEANLMLPLTKNRTISSGKVASFAVTGVAGAGYHTPGESVLNTGSITGYGSTTSANSTAANMTVAYDAGSAKYLQQFKHNEKLIYIDDVLLSSVFVADIDEMKNHYDVRSTYSREIGRALAYAADKNLIRTVIAGARKTTDRYGLTSPTTYLGSQVDISSGDATITAEELVMAIYKVAQLMDEKNVPMDGRYAIFTPEMYYLLVRGDSSKIGVAINKDYGGEGSLARGMVAEVAGIRILKSNHIPTTNESSATNIHNSAGIKNDVFESGGVGYGAADFSTTKGIAFQTDAVGTVKLMDLSVESEYIMERLGTLMLAKYAMGHGILREECCYEFVV